MPRSSDFSSVLAHLCLLVNRTSDIFSLVHASSERTAFNRRFHKPGHPILTVQTSSENDMPRWGVRSWTLESPLDTGDCLPNSAATRMYTDVERGRVGTE